MNKATPGTLWAWVYVQDEAGGNSWSLYSLVTGWYRYPVDLNAPLDVSHVNYIEIAFASTGATTATVYIDDLLLFNSTNFAESARVAQTFTKSTPTGGGPDPPRLVFDLMATPSSHRVLDLGGRVGTAGEQFRTPRASRAPAGEVEHH